MASNFTFGKKKLNNLLYEKIAKEPTGTYLNIVVDRQFDTTSLSRIVSWLTSLGAEEFRIIYALDEPVDKHLEDKSITKYFMNHRAKLEEYLVKGCPVIASGGALYSVIEDNKVYTNTTDQVDFGITNFWSSRDLTTENGFWVYPIRSFEALFKNNSSKPIDSYMTRLATRQILDALKNPKEPVIYPSLTKHFIGSNEEFYTDFYDLVKDRKGEVLSADIETDGLNFMTDHVGCITLSFDGLEGWYIPWKYVDKEKLNEVFGNNRLLGANFKFDTKMLWRNGISNCRIDEDIVILGHVLDEERSNSLKTLAYLYTPYGGYERALDKEKEDDDFENYLGIPEKILREYAIMDAIVTKRVWDGLMKHMRELDKKFPNDRFSGNTLERYYYFRNIPASNMYAKMEYTGVCVNKEKLDDLRIRLNEEIQKVKDRLSDAFGVDKKVDGFGGGKGFDWGSKREIGKMLQSKGWENLGLTKDGVYKVGDDQMTRWAKKHPEAKDLAYLASLLTLLNGFVGDDPVGDVEYGTKGWSQYLRYHKEDNTYRMHCNFKPMMADSGRSKCDSPNMQNVPTHSKWAEEVKKCVCTPNDDEYLLATQDYSALQTRLASVDIPSYEDDPLCKVLNDVNADLHSATAYLSFFKDKVVDVVEVDVEQDGKTYHFLGGEMVKTQRGKIPAKDLEETDTLII